MSSFPAPTPAPSLTVASRPCDFTLSPDRTAVIVVDMQNDFGAPGGMFDAAGIDISRIRAVVPVVAQVLAAARAAGIAVFYLKMAFRPDLSDAGKPDGPTWIKHLPLRAGEPVTAPDGSHSRILIRDCWNTEILPELAPAAGDTVLYKTRYSGFHGTELDQLLRARGIDTLVFTGCTTSICVDATLRDAMHRDYHCLLLTDCTAEPLGAEAARTNHQATLLSIEVLYGWLAGSDDFIAALAAAAATPA